MKAITYEFFRQKTLLTEVIAKVQREHDFYCFGRVCFDFLAINHTRGYVNELKIKRCRPESKICRGNF